VEAVESIGLPLRQATRTIEPTRSVKETFANRSLQMYYLQVWFMDTNSVNWVITVHYAGTVNRRHTLRCLRFYRELSINLRHNCADHGIVIPE
jgi:hypothetical protein